MEKKTKSSAKKTTKVEKVEKNEVKETVKVIDYSNILKLMFYSLVAIIVLLVALIITIIVKPMGGSTTTSDLNSQEHEESSGEYDVSMFDTLNTDDAISRIKEGDRQVVYIGRATCGYCVKFLPALQQAQAEYGYKTIYINLEEMNSDDQSKLLELDSEDYIKENYGYTPMVLIFEDGKLKKGWVGYAEYEDFAKFLEENGIKK